MGGEAGSSPLARGLRHDNSPDAPGGGIIPARAGFTDRVSKGRATFADHTRSRGVYVLFAAPDRDALGSSPLARGLRLGEVNAAARFRIIPARAGFTWSLRVPATCTADHPRSRGVYSWRLRGRFSASGSSPLARGLHELFSARLDIPRIIPARAGFTQIKAGDLIVCRDPPRSRGVYA